MRATWLADVLRAAGCKVREVNGWQARGRDLVSIQGVVWHHTASGPSSSNAQVQALLINGRPDLPGPLCQLGLERDGTWVVIAAGKGNHNGYGTWGNQAIGVEAYNSGVGEPWPQAQLDAYDLGTAAILAHENYGADRMKGHRETDPGRKIDPAGIDLNAARTRINRLIEGGFHSMEDIDMTADELSQMLDTKLAPIKTELAKVKSEVTGLKADYLTKGKSVRQVIAEIDQKTDDLVTGNRPAKG